MCLKWRNRRRKERQKERNYYAHSSTRSWSCGTWTGSCRHMTWPTRKLFSTTRGGPGLDASLGPLLRLTASFPLYQINKYRIIMTIIAYNNLFIFPSNWSNRRMVIWKIILILHSPSVYSTTEYLLYVINQDRNIRTKENVENLGDKPKFKAENWWK